MQVVTKAAFAKNIASSFSALDIDLSNLFFLKFPSNCLYALDSRPHVLGQSKVFLQLNGTFLEVEAQHAKPKVVLVLALDDRELHGVLVAPFL